MPRSDNAPKDADGCKRACFRSPIGPRHDADWLNAASCASPIAADRRCGGWWALRAQAGALKRLDRPAIPGDVVDAVATSFHRIDLDYLGAIVIACCTAPASRRISPCVRYPARTTKQTAIHASRSSRTGTVRELSRRRYLARGANGAPTGHDVFHVDQHARARFGGALRTHAIRPLGVPGPAGEALRSAQLGEDGLPLVLGADRGGLVPDGVGVVQLDGPAVQPRPVGGRGRVIHHRPDAPFGQPRSARYQIEGRDFATAGRQQVTQVPRLCRNRGCSAPASSNQSSPSSQCPLVAAGPEVIQQPWQVQALCEFLCSGMVLAGLEVILDTGPGQHIGQLAGGARRGHRGRPRRPGGGGPFRLGGDGHLLRQPPDPWGDQRGRGTRRRRVGPVRAVGTHLDDQRFTALWQRLLQSMHLELLPTTAQELLRRISTPDRELVVGYWQSFLQPTVTELTHGLDQQFTVLRRAAVPYTTVTGAPPTDPYLTWLRTALPNVGSKPVATAGISRTWRIPTGSPNYSGRARSGRNQPRAP